MSYTMTIESPEKAAWFEEQRATMSDAELGALFVMLLKQHVEAVKQVKPTQSEISPRVQALRGVIKLPPNFDEREFKDSRLAGKFGA